MLSVSLCVKVITLSGFHCIKTNWYVKYSGSLYCFGSTNTKIGTIQRRLAGPLRKDDTQNREKKKKKKKYIGSRLM